MISIVIGGDICPTHSNMSSFVTGSAEAVFHDLSEVFVEADLSIVNLECALTDHESPIAKCGPNLRAPIAAIGAIHKAGIDVLNLANNHILDHGTAGLLSTLRAADTVGIATVGAGRDRKEARRILLRTVGDIRIGVLGVAEHEFSTATARSAGANPLDLIDITRNIATERKKFDYLIVLLHGGNEHYRFPSPRLMDTCRFLVEQGANAVICQHSHCVGCCEVYRGAHIVYGQGNLVFDSSTPTDDWNEGVLIRLLIAGDYTSQIELVPFEQSLHGHGACRMRQSKAQALLKAIAMRSENLHEPAFVNEQWNQFCRERRNLYMSRMLGHGRVLRRLNRHGYLVRLLYSAKSLLAARNFIQCEAHREVLETIFDMQYDEFEF
ncbi:MAG: CapA family protein [Syntrophobacteraceae bacterium]